MKRDIVLDVVGALLATTAQCTIFGCPKWTLMIILAVANFAAFTTVGRIERAREKIGLRGGMMVSLGLAIIAAIPAAFLWPEPGFIQGATTVAILFTVIGNLSVIFLPRG